MGNIGEEAAKHQGTGKGGLNWLSLCGMVLGKTNKKGKKLDHGGALIQVKAIFEGG